MNLKQNVEFVKTEMQNDEKMLVGIFKFESFLRRHKKSIIAFIAIFILATIGHYANIYYQNYKADKLSSAYEAALSGDEAALKILEDSKSKLYDLYIFQKAIKDSNKEALEKLQNSKDPLIAQFATMQSASLSENIKGLDSKAAGDFGILQAAFLELKASNTTKAKEILSKIPNDSPIREVANALEHLTIKGIKNEN
ncbi:MAG: hypothetical protein SOW25_06530 [Helicobacter sp.]|nr:hypothetical protein [Helicobacteraceae bacterium]MDY3113965.1 hypothetical protein [Helicobacter sp.]